MGARIGRRVVIFSRIVPVCTDMLTIADDTVIRRESSFTGYPAVASVIQTGPVLIGTQALIGEHTVLERGATYAEIAAGVGCHWRTVKKYIDAGAMSVPPRGPSRKSWLPQAIAPFTGVTVAHPSGAFGQADRAVCVGITVI